jgi:hypothetical protein
VDLNLKDCSEFIKSTELPSYIGGDAPPAGPKPGELTIGPLPPTTNRGQTQDRAIGAVKGFLNYVLDVAGDLGAPDQNLDQIRSALDLYPASQNQEFGGEVFGIAALFSGGGKTGRKITEKAYLAATESVKLLERVLLRLEQTPGKTQATKEAICIVEGKLSKAQEALRRSEPHAIRGQGYR